MAKPSSLASTEGRTDTLWSPSFVGLLTTQMLTATNDNIFRWLVIGLGKRLVEPSQVGNILTAGTACFVVPYILLAAPAGYLADRFSKRSVIVGCKVAEIAIMFLGLLAIWSQNLWVIFGVVACMGAQSALFSPSKLGCIPEILKAKHISNANGLVGLTTVTAIVIGTGTGNILSDKMSPEVAGQPLQNWPLAIGVLLGVAVAGCLASLTIKRLPAANPNRLFPWNALTVTIRSIKVLSSSRPMLRVAVGIAFFWSLGTLANLNIDQFGFEGGITGQTKIVPLLISLVLGMGVGSVLAGIWSGGRVELGILPLGAAGIAVSSMLLFTIQGSLVAPGASLTPGYFTSCFFLFLLGSSAGLFDIPLSSYMQHRSPAESRGSILAASNLITFTGILLASLLFAGMRAPIRDGLPLLSARQIFLVCGLLTIAVFFYIVLLLPQASLRFVVWLASKTVYRIRVFGEQNIPEQGGALLTANHVSFLDAILLLLASSRPIRMVAYAGYLQNPIVKRVTELWGVIPITAGPKSIVNALQTANQALKDGEIVCIFPEGEITRTGQMQAFKPGLMKILKGTNVPVIPVYLDELWGSIFSFHRRRFFWKIPRKWPYPVSVHFGSALEHPDDAHQVRQAVQHLGAVAMEYRMQRQLSLPRNLIRSCKQRKFGSKAADSSGQELSGGSVLMRSLILRRLLLRHVFSSEEKNVGLLLPPSVGGTLANLALALDRRVAINLNYTVSEDVMNSCVQQSELQHVLTSRKFTEKLKSMNLDITNIKATPVYLEDFRDKVTWRDKLGAFIDAYLLPAGVLERRLKLQEISLDDVLTIVFTSGSTGRPKGVMLSHANIAANVNSVDQIFHLTSDDVLVGILPFFHSFGYTVGLWTAMALDIKGIYHFNPLDAKQIGKLSEKHKATILVATPTFLRSYLRRITKEQFASMDIVVVGAEKLPQELSNAFEDKFGVRPVEGYGATELSPLVSVNVPPSRSKESFEDGVKEGSVGRPIPGVSARVAHLETGEDVGVNEPGMLMITGANVMKGYLNEPEKTAEVLRDGWYVTGDVAKIDKRGFIEITGRESRFSKIGGEMVPHIKIEETLTEMVGVDEDAGPKLAVTAVPDKKKGERLIVVHTKLDQEPAELCRGLQDVGLPNIFIPSPDSFFEVDELPMLGSGKLDLKGIKEIALDNFS